MSGDESGNDGDPDGADDNWVSDSVDEGDASPVDDGQPTDAGGADQSADGGPTGSPKKGPDEKFCAECGAVINEKAEICPECGVRQPGMGSSDDERLIAALLAIFLGAFGAHKFYLGQTGLGILYLCFFWTMIPGLIGIVEGLIYLSKSDEEFHRQYMQD
ncbi:NINE protein [Halosimplex aquaticum]|uniref:NINE protein n=1 Tax=Halosimplex aquaticum TaxID=3026162 RepID=A0ABD5Y1Q3_9EURY|nr:NINE protein [Halosimplex aquaticum]